MFKNFTKNQHYISQSEQRLNSINPQAKKENQKIYEFKVIDRYKLLLSSPKAKKIRNNLAIENLFSFWVENEKDKDIYYNFENFFKKYEDKISSDTNSLIEKILSENSDCKKELRNIICGKMMNYFRNPFCTKEHLSKLEKIFKRFHPTNKKQYSYFRKIDRTNADLTQTCSYLGVKKKEYLEWLKMIFFIFSIYDDKGKNILEKLVDDIILDPYSMSTLWVYYYDREACLLSDKGQCNFALDKNTDCFQFNLSSKCFASFIYRNVRNKIEDFADGSVHRKEFIKHWNTSPKKFDINVILNDFEALKSYNTRVISSCHENCYSASNDTPLGCFIENP